MLAIKINTATLHRVNKHLSNIFTATKCTTIINEMKIYQKHWFKEIKSPLIPIKKRLIMYYNKFKTSNFVIDNNSSPSIGVL